MWKLIITDDQGQHTVVNLVRDEYGIGRSEDNPVRLTERNVSRSHAVLRKTGNTFAIADLRSSNGLFVNGVRITGQQPLGHRDLIQLGDYRIEVVDETLDTQEQGHHPYPRPSTDTPARLPHRLVVLIGPEQGTEYALEGDRYLIGRDDDCDFRIDHGSVSRIHAEVRRLDEEHFEIIDKGSANGLRINGHERPRAVLDGRDVVELGDVVLKYIMKGQVFRVDAAEGERIAAMSGASLPPPLVEARLPFGAPLIAALAGALVIFGLFLWQVRMPTSEQDAEAVAALALGSQLLEAGDVFGAHEAVAPLAGHPELLATDELHRIEAAWASAMFASAAAEEEPQRRRELLWQVIKSETLPAAARATARQMLAAVGDPDAETDAVPSDNAVLDEEMPSDDAVLDEEMPGDDAVFDEEMPGDDTSP